MRVGFLNALRERDIRAMLHIIKIGSLDVLRKKDIGAILLGLAPFVVFAAAFLVLLRPITLRGSSDDTAHLTDILQMGVFKWVWMRATTWQPRIASDFGFAALIFNLRIWKVLTAGIMALLLWVITRTALFGESDTTGQQKASRVRFATLALFVVPMLFLIHPNVITSGSIWYAGSFYYLWPLTAMFIGLAPFLLAFYGKRLLWQPVLLPVCVFFGILACFTEQTAAVQFGMIALIFAWMLIRHERIPRYMIVSAVIIAVTTIVFFYFDMTSVRMTSNVTLQYFPEFAGFSFTKKLALGMNLYTSHLLHVSNILFSVVTVMAGWLVFRRTKSRMLRTLAVVPGFWALFNTVPLPFGYPPGVAEQVKRNGALGFGIADWLKYVNGKASLLVPPTPTGVILATVALLCALSVFLVLVFAFQSVRDRFIALALYLAAFLTGLLNGFSPPVFDSGNRAFFVPDFLLLLLLAMLLRSRLAGSSAPAGGFSLRNWLTRILLGALIVFACYVWYLFHTVFATNSFWWY